MSLSFSIGCRGVLPPALIGALGLVACGGSTGSPEQATPAVPAASGESADTDSDVVTQPSVQASLPPSADDDLPDGVAASLVNVWQFDHRRMSKRFLHMHDPRAGSSGTVSLMYSAVDSAGRYINLEWPYDGQAVTYRYDGLTVAPSYIAFGEDNLPRDWQVTAGEVEIAPLPNGQVLVDLKDLEIAELLGASQESPEPLADGFVLGDVERVCLEYFVPTGDVPINLETGEPALEARRDTDWSSPYCAQFAR
jgi:hypothetical protein